MRIQSIYKDYYDSGLSYGVDSEIFYYRKNYNLKFYYSKNEIEDKIKNFNKEEIEKFHLFINEIKNVENPYRKSYLYEIFIEDNVSYQISFNSLFIGTEIIHFARIAKIRTINKIEELLEEEFEYNVEILVKKYRSLIDMKKSKYKPYYHDIKKWFNSYTENIESIKNKLNFIFKLYDTPMFLIRNYKNDTNLNNEKIEEGIIINPILKNIQLKNIIDPYICFQKISMFLNFLHNPEEEVKITEINDEVKRDSHGFDKCSFKSCGNKKK